MTFIDPISNSVYDYSSEMPKDSFTKAGLSGVLSYTVTLIGVGIFGSFNFTRPLVCATLAATASLVDSLIKPIMNRLLKDIDDCSALLFNRVVVLSLVGCALKLIAPQFFNPILGFVSLLGSFINVSKRESPDTAALYSVIWF